MQYKTTWSSQPGYTQLVQPGDAGLKLISFGILSLRSGECYTIDASDKEAALVLLGGAALLRGPGLPEQKIGPRVNVFEARPWTVLLPPGTSYEIEAIGDLEIAVCQSPSDRDGAPRIIRPDDVKELSIGRDNWQRRAIIMVDEHQPADYLFIGEAYTPSGNWSSFPPHRHDYDALPDEVDMEEIYYFRFNPPKGFGIQKIYTDDRSIDETFTISQHDTALLPRGYHPVVAVPGYTMYFLWVMAGKNRRFLSRLDPDHSWVADSGRTE